MRVLDICPIFSPSVRHIRAWQRGADNRESEGQGKQSPALQRSKTRSEDLKLLCDYNAHLLLVLSQYPMVVRYISKFSYNETDKLRNNLDKFIITLRLIILQKIPNIIQRGVPPVPL